jgi:hypothetical protein
VVSEHAVRGGVQRFHCSGSCDEEQIRRWPEDIGDDASAEASYGFVVFCLCLSLRV